MKVYLLLFPILGLLISNGGFSGVFLSASDPIKEPVSSILSRHCKECHNGPRPKADFNLEKLTANFSDIANQNHWRAVLEQIQGGTMPPKSKPRMSANETMTVVRWVTEQLEPVEKMQQMTQGRTTLRRLNRVEYENTVRDLLGIDIELQELLPTDASANGFDNNGEALHVSSFLMEKYLEAADIALNKAITNGPKPPLVKKRYLLHDDRTVKTSSESVYLIRDDAVVMFSSSAWNAITLWDFYPPDRGKYRFRISASGYQSNDKPVTFRVDAGPMLMATKNHMVGYFDAAPNQATIIEFIDHFEARNHIRIHPYGLAPAQTVTKLGATRYDGPGLAVNWIDVEGPLNDTWPPESHRRIFGDMDQKPASGYNFPNRVEVVSKQPETDARRILGDFASRAYRRKVTEEELMPILALVKTRIKAKHSFEQAIRVGLTAVMVSPEFLFLREKPGKLDDAELANRLSYFLWSTMPDDKLAKAAAQGKLSGPALQQQVERMLNHPRASAFTENFVGQWLGLRDIDFTEPSQILYPEYDAMLRHSMVRETELFFAEVLKDDLSIANFVSSEFSILNGRLASHYGIPGVTGNDFRKVKLPTDSHRGGVMTMASVLKVTANGTSTSPVTRGAWVLDRILGTPPPRPPSDVPTLEPDIRGATTIREQLAKHRQIESCAICHKKIDPPGFALENYDVIGGYRTQYRTTGDGDRKEVVKDGRRMPYRLGLKVDPADVTEKGQKFGNIDELKELLLRDKDQLARSLVEKVVTYATGAAPRQPDKTEIETIVARVRNQNYGFRSLVHAVVQSRIFQTK